MSKFELPEYFEQLQLMVADEILPYYIKIESALFIQNVSSHIAEIDDRLMDPSLTTQEKLIAINKVYRTMVAGVFSEQGITVDFGDDVSFVTMADMYAALVILVNAKDELMLELFDTVEIDDSDDFLYVATLFSTLTGVGPDQYLPVIKRVAPRVIEYFTMKLTNTELFDVSVTREANIKRFKHAVTLIGDGNPVVEWVKTGNCIDFDPAIYLNEIMDLLNEYPDNPEGNAVVATGLKLYLLASNCHNDAIDDMYSDLIDQFTDDPMRSVRISYVNLGVLNDAT